MGLRGFNRSAVPFVVAAALVGNGIAQEAAKPREAAQSAAKVPVSMVMGVSAKEASKKFGDLYVMTDPDELEKAAAKAGLKVKNYGPLGAILIDGDPFDLEGRRGRVAILQDFLKLGGNGMKRPKISDFSPDARRELSRQVGYHAMCANWVGEVPDIASTPISFQSSGVVSVSGEGKTCSTPFYFGPRIGVERPDKSSLPLAKGGKVRPDGTLEPAVVEPLRTGQVFFSTSPAVTATVAKTKLMAAYLKDVEKEADELYGAWQDAMSAFGAQSTDKLPEVGNSIDALSTKMRSDIEAHVLSSPSSYGFANRQEAEAFLSKAKVSNVRTNISLEWIVRLPNGETGSGSFQISP